jgi:hypothetical protein
MRKLFAAPYAEKDGAIRRVKHQLETWNLASCFI